MNIGQASARSGLPPKTIRYYEDVGLIRPARRANSFRDYDAREVSELQFIARARGLGFSVEECRHLLDLYRDRSRSSADVKAAVASHIATIKTKIRELKSMERTLTDLHHRCSGDNRPDCPILDGLAGGND